MSAMTVQVLDRYITAEIVRPFLLGTGLLVLIFAGYSTAIRMADAANGLITPTTVAKLTGLNIMMALEVLLPTALYLSALAAIGRLHRDSEMAALHAAGIGEFRILVAVVKLSVAVALVTGFLSLTGRPWAYGQTYALEAAAQQAVQLQRIEAGTFVELPDTGYVLFARRVDRETGVLGDLFLRKIYPRRTEIITAREAEFRLPGPEQPGRVEFRDGHTYVLDHRGRRDLQQGFNSLVIHLAETETQTRFRRKAEPTWSLLDSPAIKDVAEIQWRFSTPLATVLLAMLAVPLARSGPRQSRTSGMIFGLAVYTLFFGVATVARNLVEEGTVAAMPGIWWSYALLAAVVFVLLIWPRLRLLLRRR
jgi:lipopolysaccharide export system permease protein